MSERGEGFAPSDDPRAWFRANGEGGPVTIDGLTVYSVRDMLNLPRRDYIVKGVFAPAEISVIVGPPKCGKSFFVMHIGYAIAQARQVFGHRVKPVTVLYAAAEGERGISKRIDALTRHYGEAVHFHAVAQPIDLLHSDTSQGHLAALIKIARMVGAGFIVIDTLNRAIAGGDENSSQDMGHFIANLSDLRHETGAHIAIVHHGNEASEGTKPRGHSSLKGAADVIIQVTKDEDGTRRALIANAKDDADGDVMGFKLNLAELGEDEDGDPITTLLVEELTEIPQKAASLSKGAKAAFQILVNLIASHGSPLPPGVDFPPSVHGCRETDWIIEAEARHLSNATREGDRRKYAKDALTALQNARMIAWREDWLWLI